MSNAASKRLDKKLKKLLADGPERGGIILPNGRIVELANMSDDPIEGFYPKHEDLLPHLDKMVATWHTHPGETSNLSVEDWNTFLQWPQIEHAIIGIDGVRWYRVHNGAVVNA